MLQYGGVLRRDAPRCIERRSPEHEDPRDRDGLIVERSGGHQHAALCHAANVGHVGGLDAFALVFRKWLSGRIRAQEDQVVDFGRTGRRQRLREKQNHPRDQQIHGR